VDIGVEPAGVKDGQLVRSDWQPAEQGFIDGVRTQLIQNVLSDRGRLTECWRADWALDEGGEVGQVFQQVMQPAALSAWHVHLLTTDRLFCALGSVRVVLYDARIGSPTYGALLDLRMGEHRPAAVSVPPGVYHGVKNIGDGPSLLLNVVDVAYDYEDPDHYRLPPDATEIPFVW
jgi:dTDP-4-dehydrorhamnose 3,5-epimerase